MTIRELIDELEGIALREAAMGDQTEVLTFHDCQAPNVFYSEDGRVYIEPGSS